MKKATWRPGAGAGLLVGREGAACLLREIRVSVPVGLVDRLDWENGSREERDAMVADALQEYFDDWHRQNAEAGIK